MAVLLDAGAVAGILVADPGANELMSLYVRPESQHRGLGRWALSWAMETLLDKTRPMRVTALCDNQTAIALYRSAGFTQTGETRVLNPERGVSEMDLIRPGDA